MLLDMNGPAPCAFHLLQISSPTFISSALLFPLLLSSPLPSHSLFGRRLSFLNSLAPIGHRASDMSRQNPTARGWRLPSELTKLVLSMLREKPEEYRSICSAVRVCKEWKVCIQTSSQRDDRKLTTRGDSQTLGESVLMETVVIKTLGQLTALCERLTSSVCIDDKPAGRMVQELLMQPSYDEDENNSHGEAHLSDMVLSVLMQTPYIRTYDTFGSIPPSRSTFTCLSTLCASTLVELDVAISPSTDGIFPVINSLQNLKILHLRCRNGRWTHSSARPLSMASLHHLHFESQCSQDPMLEFLSQCSLGGKPRQTTLELDIPNLLAHQAHKLEPLLASPSVKGLILSLPSSSLTKLASCIMKSESITFCDFMPPPGLLTTLPGVLALSYPLGEPGRQRGFWDFLKHLSNSAITGPQPSFIEIFYENDSNDGFDWLCTVDAEYVSFVGRLLSIAVRLFKRNVVVIDKHGRSVESLTAD
jgi:hypothetical protein